MPTIDAPLRIERHRLTAAVLVASLLGLLLSIAISGRAEAALPAGYKCGGWQTAVINNTAVKVLYRACIHTSAAVAGKFDGWLQFDASDNVTVWFVDGVRYNGGSAQSYGGKWRNLQGEAPDPSSDASYPGHSCVRGQLVQYGVAVREVTKPVPGFGPTAWSVAMTCP